MRLVSVLFGDDAKYERLARVLAASAAASSPATPLELVRVRDPDPEVYQHAALRQRRKITDNARKTKHHAAAVAEASAGELVGLLDCDTMITRSLADVQELDFDLAITVRPPGAKYWFNSGVVFVRVSSATQELYGRWWQAVRQLLANADELRRWHPQYGGINQCAFGKLREEGALADLRIRELPCSEWNSIEETWRDFGPETRVVHLLRRLKLACVQPGRVERDPQLRRLAKRWRDFEALSRQTEPLSRRDRA